MSAELLSSYPLLALAVSCPRCGSAPRQRCTSHSGTRTRRHDVHQDRTGAYRAFLAEHRVVLEEQVRCPACDTWGGWTDGRSRAAGDPVDEYWCPCGAQSPLARCERRPTVAAPRTRAQEATDQHAQDLADAALNTLLTDAGPGSPVTFTSAQAALLAAGILPAPEWTIRRLTELAAEGRLVADGPESWRTPA